MNFRQGEEKESIIKKLKNLREAKKSFIEEYGKIYESKSVEKGYSSSIEIEKNNSEYTYDILNRERIGSKAAKARMVKRSQYKTPWN